MRGANNQAVYVPCSACNATGKIKAVTHRLEVREIVCERCLGKRMIVVPRLKTAPINRGELTVSGESR